MAGTERAASGAGVVIWKATEGGLFLLDWATCTDNDLDNAALAEAMGAREALKLGLLHAKREGIGNLLIQGDNKAVIDFLKGDAKIQDPKMASILGDAVQVLASSPSIVEWEKIPREANKFADKLAGAASKAAQQDVPNAGIFFRWQGKELQELMAGSIEAIPNDGTTQVVEQAPNIDQDEEKLLWTLEGLPLWKKVIAQNQCRQSEAKIVSYAPKRSDGSGRRYPTGKQGGHSLYSRDLRLLLYGKHTFEYDVKSSFWAMALAFRNNVRALLGVDNVQQLRDMVDDAMAGPKRTWPTQAKDVLAWALNMQPTPCLEKIRGMGFPLPPGIQGLIPKLHEVKNILRAEDAITDGDVGGDPRTNQRNYNYFVVEKLESKVMRTFIATLREVAPALPFIWVHDGIWATKEAEDTILRAWRDAQHFLGIDGVELIPKDVHEERAQLLTRLQYPPDGNKGVRDHDFNKQATRNETFDMRKRRKPFNASPASWAQTLDSFFKRGEKRKLDSLSLIQV